MAIFDTARSNAAWRHAYRLATGPKAPDALRDDRPVLFGLAPDTVMFAF
jgi:hypothetical protein